MSSIDRRTLLGRAFWLAGATLAPGVGIEALAQSAAKAARHLDAPRFELLSAVADTMVPRTDTPGAVDADVPRKFDALLRDWASPQRRADLIGALEAIDRRALAEDKRGYAKLAPARRQALLAAHDAQALTPPSAPAAAAQPPTTADPNYGRLKQEPPQTKGAGTTKQEGESFFGMSGPKVSDPAYSKLKELIVTLYYVSEQALTHELTYEHSPGEWKPSIPVTPATRPAGGLGPV